MGCRLEAAGCLLGLGEIYPILGQNTNGRRKVQATLVVFEDIGHRLGAAQCRQSLGNLQYMAGQYDDARRGVLSVWRYERPLWRWWLFWKPESHQQDSGQGLGSRVSFAGRCDRTFITSIGICFLGFHIPVLLWIWIRNIDWHVFIGPCIALCHPGVGYPWSHLKLGPGECDEKLQRDFRDASRWLRAQQVQINGWRSWLLL